jgi:purine-binding chemotaxis protein CheW
MEPIMQTPTSGPSDRGAAPQAAAGRHLTFRLGAGRYGVPLLRVREILRLPEVTRVPGTPAAFLGVINLRGNAVTIVDLAVQLGLPATAIGKRTCAIVVDVELDGTRALLGVVVDEVESVIAFGAADLRPVPAFGNPVRLDLLAALGIVESGFVFLLDLPRVLSAHELMPA